MKARPSLLAWQCIFLVGLAASFPAQIMALFGHSPLEWNEIAAKLAPMNWVVIGLALASAAAAWRASPLLLGFFPPLLSCSVLYNNWIVAATHLNYSPGTAWSAGLVGAALINLPVLNPSVRALLHQPARRWWLTPQRYPIELPIRIKLHMASGSNEFQAQTFDLSEGGAFIRVEPGATEVIRVGTQCYVSLPLRGLNRISCRAEVVRAAAASGRYPEGLGIRFLGLGWRARSALEGYLQYRAEQKRDS